MATECQLPFTDDDEKMLQEAEERGTVVPECFTKPDPEVERVIEERCIECLRENVENSQNELRERLAQNEPTDLEHLDLRAEPTKRECRELFRIGKGIGMEGWEIANYPVVMGIKDPETLERIPDMEKRVEGLMERLHGSRLSPWFRDAEVVDRIMFIDKDEPATEKGKGAAGAVLGKRKLATEPELSRVVHLFRDPNTHKLPDDHGAYRATIHEIVHLNLHKGQLTGEASKFEQVFRDHQDEWDEVCAAQRFGPDYVTEYAKDDFEREQSLGRAGNFGHEFIAEHVSYWDAQDKSDLEDAQVCPEMQAFFDKYLA